VKDLYRWHDGATGITDALIHELSSAPPDGGPDGPPPEHRRRPPGSGRNRLSVSSDRPGGSANATEARRRQTLKNIFSDG
jgi:hypothetical protein